MKKILALLMIAAVMVSLAACSGTSNNSESHEALVKHEMSYYTSQGFYGLQCYLVDYEFVYYADMKPYQPATSSEASPNETPDKTSGNRTAIYYELLGAAKGIRFMVSDSAFIELYDFTPDKLTDQELAAKTLEDIRDDGKITVVEGMDALNGVISKSGNYVILYNSNNKYDYDKITDELEKW